jgi:hypothetical protein
VTNPDVCTVKLFTLVINTVIEKGSATGHFRPSLVFVGKASKALTNVLAYNGVVSITKVKMFVVLAQEVLTSK